MDKLPKRYKDNTKFIRILLQIGWIIALGPIKVYSITRQNLNRRQSIIFCISLKRQEKIMYHMQDETIQSIQKFREYYANNQFP